MPDLVEKVAAQLRAFDGDEPIADGQAEPAREVYRNRAVLLLSAVRQHDESTLAGDDGAGETAWPAWLRAHKPNPRPDRIHVYFCSACGYACGILDYDRIRHEHFDNDRRCEGGRWDVREYVTEGEPARRIATWLRARADRWSAGDVGIPVLREAAEAIDREFGDKDKGPDHKNK